MQTKGFASVPSSDFTHLAVFHFVLDAAPSYTTRSETENIDGEVDEIAQWHEPDATAEELVANAPDPDRPGHREPQDEISDQIGRGDCGAGRDGSGENCPGQTMGEEQAEERCGAHLADGAGPA